MKQVVRRVIDRKGRVKIIELPEPHVGPEQVLVQNVYSLISSGTELGTIGKTPVELVRQTIADPWMRHVVKQTVLATGPAQTARRVWQEMIMPREIGYSAAGRVLAVGEHVEGLQVGQPVAYAATGHAELVAPHINHIVPVPDTVDLCHAAFVTVGGIVIQSLRRAEVQFGETIAVYGLGLLGQICARVAKAAGCVVVGIDIDEQRNELAERGGVELVVNPSKTDLKRQVMDFTQKHGVDATIICASSDSDTIINSSMEITRRQGRVVVVGYVKLNIHPKEFLYRELDLKYSRAYGPGSYHTAYEKGRIDYPFGYVRWTEKRNLQEFIRLLHTGAVDLQPLIGETYSVDRAQEAFDAIRAGSLSGVAAVIAYDTETEPDRRKTLEVKVRPKKKGKAGISIIGCGNHVLGKHLPNLRKHPDVELRGLASATGKNASMIAESVGATVITTDVQELLSDQDTDALMVCSSQPEHFGHVCQAIQAGKAIYVEKPMVTLLSDFREVVKLMEQNPILLTLGLNRRYSPMVARLRKLIEGPVDSVQYLITQPYVPPDHWTLDEVEGGGRLITEGEHFIDLCHLLIGRPPITVSARALGKAPDDIRNLCNFAVTIEYEEAVATVVFNESGAADFPREQLTVLARGQVAVLDDFAKLTVHGRKRQVYGSPRRKEMGHREALSEFVAAVRGEPSRMLTWEEASLATTCMFAAQESIRSGAPVDLREFRQTLPEKASI
jgi:polar amino acid transport system substrate-binding protein